MLIKVNVNENVNDVNVNNVNVNEHEVLLIQLWHLPSARGNTANI